MFENVYNVLKTHRNPSRKKPLRSLHFTGEETGAQSREVTCPSHSEEQLCPNLLPWGLVLLSSHRAHHGSWNQPAPPSTDPSRVSTTCSQQSLEGSRELTKQMLPLSSISLKMSPPHSQLDALHIKLYLKRCEREVAWGIGSLIQKSVALELFPTCVSQSRVLILCVWCQATCICVLFSPLAGCVTLGRLLNLSVPVKEEH